MDELFQKRQFSLVQNLTLSPRLFPRALSAVCLRRDAICICILVWCGGGAQIMFFTMKCLIVSSRGHCVRKEKTMFSPSSLDRDKS